MDAVVGRHPLQSRAPAFRFCQMYGKASLSRAIEKHPSSNGSGLFASQQTATHAGAMIRRASHSFQKYRSARTTPLRAG